jgi:hypothetical protein
MSWFTSGECENGCDLFVFGTHQEDCPHEPRDKPEIAAVPLDYMDRRALKAEAELKRLQDGIRSQALALDYIHYPCYCQRPGTPQVL